MPASLIVGAFHVETGNAMRLTVPRIAPLTDEGISPQLAPLVDRQRGRSGRLLNIFRTLARAPEALPGFLGWAEYILSERNTLPAREREIVILRVAFTCASGYEWSQHRRIALRCGVSENEIENVKRYPHQDAVFSPQIRTLLDATDALIREQFLPDPLWAALREHFSERQAMDLVFTVGQYVQVAMMLNTFGVQLESGNSGDTALTG
jgi:alkylhydroperoxidase family enzyme